MRQGFTLIELSIVLVIIGLIVGGVLVGQDLIKAASIRAQISQIERYGTAVNTFRVKYGDLPGDITANAASAIGLAARGTVPGSGDGDGLIEGSLSGTADPRFQGAGETVLFWMDLSTVGLIEGSFTTGNATTYDSTEVKGAKIKLYLPVAKIGNGNYLFVYSYGGFNWFGLSAVYSPNGPAFSDGFATVTGFGTNLALDVASAYSIDAKIDDGYPTTGNVIARYINSEPGSVVVWPGDYFASGPPGGGGAIAASTSTCFDDGGNTNNVWQYSMAVNNGASSTCALSFRFQ